MSTIDLILVILLAAFVGYGFWAGFIHALGALVGVAFGAFGAGRIFEPIAMQLLPLFGGNANVARVVTFLVLFTLGNRIVGVLFTVIERTYKLFTVIPFLSSANRLAGAVFGFLEGSAVIGGALMLTAKFPIGAAFTQAVTASMVAAYLLSVAKIILPLLPAVLREIDKTLPYKLPLT